MNGVFRSLTSLSKFVIGGISAVIILNLLVSFFSIYLLTTTDLSVNPALATESGGLMTFILFVGGLSLIQFLCYIITIVVFLIWLYRATANLTPLKAEVNEYSPGWAVGWWFIPFANLIKPFQVVREVWCESDPETIPGETFSLAGPHSAPAFMVAWWVLWIVSNVFSVFIRNATAYSSELAIFLLVITICYFISGMLLIKIVKDISDRQELRSKLVSNEDTLGVPPPPVFERQDNHADVSEDDAAEQARSERKSF